MFSDYKIQIDQILKNTDKKESCNDPEFDAALSLEWKSAGRLLKHIWSNAEKMALTHGSAASCCLPEEVVYTWVREYYFLDDRETVMKEKAEQAATERKQREMKEKEAQYHKKALETLSKKSGWDDLSAEEKKKKIAAKIKSLKADDARKSQKSTATDNAISSADGEKAGTTPDEPQNDCSRMCNTENSVRLEIDFANTLDGQMNLFSLM